MTDCCLTPIKPARSIDKKALLTEKVFSFPFNVQPDETLRLNFDFTARTMGRPVIKHLYGLNRVSRSSGRETEPQLAFQGRDPTPCPGPETHDSKPTRYPFKSKTACPRGFQFFVDVRLGRSRQIVF